MRRLLALLVLVSSVNLAFAEEWMVRRQVASSFTDTRDAIVTAIENRGIVINYKARIADMLERTGADIGATKKIFDQAETVEFCSAALSRKMMESSPHYIVLCPFTISIYTLPGDARGTWVAYRKPQGRAARMVEGLLREVSAEAGPAVRSK